MKEIFQKSFSIISKHLSVWQEVLRYNKVTSLVRRRVLFLTGSFFCCFFLVGIRLVDLMIMEHSQVRICGMQNNIFYGGVPRADIVDRHGIILATHLVTASAYVDTRDIQNVEESIQALHSVLKEVPLENLYQKLNSGKSFVWLIRHLTPKRQEEIQRLGLPGVYLKKDYKRVYPFGNLASHLIGFCDIDGNGLAGVENYFDSYLLKSSEPLKLSIDIKIQHIVAKILEEAIKEFKAIGGNAIVMNAQTGEILAMESLPNFDLNLFHETKKEDYFFNRNTLGVYEMGSVFKILNVAIALESGKVTKKSLFDVREPIKIGRFTVTDFRGQNRILNLEEAFVYSSNVAAIKIAQQFGGGEIQKKFFKLFGIFDPVELELFELGRPIYEPRWTNATMMSSTYGYGIAISPLRLLSTICGIINDGYLVNPTLLCGKKNEGKRIVSLQTSQDIRHMMRKVICEGTARRANVNGYRVFGKTGTAYKNKKGRYDQNRARRTIFVGGFPEESPKYMILFMLDEPKAKENTFGYATAGWNVAPYGGKLIERIAPLLGVKIVEEHESKENFRKQPLIQKTKQYMNMTHLFKETK